jgi:hypothetical protein
MRGVRDEHHRGHGVRPLSMRELHRATRLHLPATMLHHRESTLPMGHGTPPPLQLASGMELDPLLSGMSGLLLHQPLSGTPLLLSVRPLWDGLILSLSSCSLTQVYGTCDYPQVWGRVSPFIIVYFILLA